VLPYAPRFRWIRWCWCGLVPAARHRHELLQLCIARRASWGWCRGSTPAGGREVYRPLGFRDGWPITRWRRAADASAAVLPASAHGARALREQDWAGLARLDARAFGADRTGLLRALQARSASFACVLERQGRVAGYLLGREGRAATQLGPLVAEDAGAAQALLAHALPRVAGAVIVDALDRQQDFARLLAQSGFAVERPYTRMALDSDGAFGDADLGFAIAGPELG